MNQRKIKEKLKSFLFKSYFDEEIENCIDENFKYDEDNDQVYLKVAENHFLLIHDEDILAKIVRLSHTIYDNYQLIQLIQQI